MQYRHNKNKNEWRQERYGYSDKQVVQSYFLPFPHPHVEISGLLRTGGFSALPAEKSSVRQSTSFLGDEEIETRYQLKYRGQAPRRKVPGNVNYCDHNILGLQNRSGTNKVSDPADAPLFDSADTSLKRNKSVPSVYPHGDVYGLDSVSGRRQGHRGPPVPSGDWLENDPRDESPALHRRSKREGN